MGVSWYFYRFDYERYVEVRPALRSATRPGAFSAISETPEMQTIVESLSDGLITPSQARHGFVESLCCLGDPLPFDRGFPRFIAAMARRSSAADAAELLGSMVAGGKNMEAWLLPASGLVGFLTPPETVRLQEAYASLRRRGRLGSGRHGKRLRHGGLVGAIVGFGRSLLDRGPQPDEMLRQLGDLIDEAVEDGDGIAVVAA
jgi:hypothetical protein